MSLPLLPRATGLALALLTGAVERLDGQELAAPDQLADGLPAAAPAALGLHPEPLGALPRAVAQGHFPRTTGVLLAVRGRLVYEAYFGDGGRDTLNDTRSVGKSITALAVLAAQADGLFASLSEPAFARLPDLAPFAHDGPLKQGITLEDLLTMSSALDCNDDDPASPGNEENMYPRERWSRWAVDLPVRAGYGRDSTGRGPFSYCTAGTFLLGQVLQRAAGEPVDRYIERRLLRPLGILRLRWARSPSGEVMTGGGLRLRGRDLLKLGLLLQAGGQWNGRTVLPTSAVAQALRVHRQASAQQGYGYLFWQRVYTGHCGPEEAWYMSGNGGNVVVLLPEEEAVVVVTRRNYSTRGMHLETITLIERHVLPALPCRRPS